MAAWYFMRKMRHSGVWIWTRVLQHLSISAFAVQFDDIPSRIFDQQYIESTFLQKLLDQIYLGQGLEDETLAVFVIAIGSSLKVSISSKKCLKIQWLLALTSTCTSCSRIAIIF